MEKQLSYISSYKLDSYIGKTIDGVLITESGLAAAACIYLYQSNDNLLNHMENGLEDTIISELYYQDIKDVEYLTNGSIEIKFIDIDLNNDGLNDKIVIIRSPLHSGSRGDKFDILLNNFGSFETIYMGVIRLYSQKWESIGYVGISKNIVNGFKGIEIHTENREFTFNYNGTSYR